MLKKYVFKTCHLICSNPQHKYLETNLVAEVNIM